MLQVKVKVENIIGKNGNTIPNQFIITTDKGLFFQSYKSIIAFKPFNGKIQLDSKYWNYSVTTSKYRNLFSNESMKETQNKINNSEYILTNLN